jgi:hypothetical protein
MESTLSGLIAPHSSFAIPSPIDALCRRLTTILSSCTLGFPGVYLKLEYAQIYYDNACDLPKRQSANPVLFLLERCVMYYG